MYAILTSLVLTINKNNFERFGRVADVIRVAVLFLFKQMAADACAQLKKKC